MSVQKPVDTIKCPKCNNLIPVTETLRRQLAEEAKAELEQELAGQHAVDPSAETSE